MPTLVDSLIVRLALDKTDFDAAKQEAERDLETAAGRLRGHGSEIERSLGTKIESGFRRIQLQLVAFFAAVFAARGVADFVSSTVRAEVSLGLLSDTLGVMPQKLSAYQMAVERLGGSTESTNSALSGFHNAMMRWKLEGATPDFWLTNLAGPSGNVSSLLGAKDEIEQLKMLAGFAETYQRQRHMSRESMMFAMDRAGMPGHLAQFLLQGKKAVSAQLDASGANAITGDQVKSGERIFSSWKELQFAVQSVGRAVFEKIEPVLTPLFDQLDKWLLANKDAITEWVDSHIKKLEAWWKGGGQDMVFGWIKDVYGWLKKLADAMGGWENLFLTMFGIWAADHLLPLNLLFTAISGLFLAVSSSSFLGALAAALTAYAMIKGGAASKGAPAAPAAPGAAPAAASEGGSPATAATSPDAAPKDSGMTVQVQGADVSEANPLPVKLVGMADVFGLVGSLFGFGGATPGRGGALSDGQKSAVSRMAPTSDEVKALMASGKFPNTPAGHEAWIRTVFAKYGVNPDLGAGIAHAEGNNPLGWSKPNQGSTVDVDANGRPFSFGDFQMNMHPGALGDVMLKQSGIDARDGSTWMQQDEWVARYMSSHGRAGLQPWVGDPVARGWQGPVTVPATGAKPAAGEHAAKHESHLSAPKRVSLGALHVTVPSADPRVIARGIRQALHEEMARG